MKSKIKTLLRYKMANWALKVFFFFWLTSFLVLIVKWPNLPPEVPLYYSLPWGEEQLASPFELLILPFSALFFFCLNFFLASIFFEKEPWLCRILILTGIIFPFLAALGLVKIVFLVT